MTPDQKELARICKDAGYDAACMDAIESAWLLGRKNRDKSARMTATLREHRLNKPFTSTVGNRLLAWCRWRAKG